MYGSMSGGGVGARVAGSGGTRTDWPEARRVAASARRPSTRTWPERHSFWIAPCVTPGKCRRNQRSSRMSNSSSDTMRLAMAMTEAFYRTPRRNALRFSALPARTLMVLGRRCRGVHVCTMLRRFEALLDPTARPPNAPPTEGLWPFYWHFIRQEGWLVVALFVFGGLIAMLDVTIPAFIGRVVGFVSTHAPGELLRETWPQLVVMARRAAARAPGGVPRPCRADQPDHQPGPAPT